MNKVKEFFSNQENKKKIYFIFGGILGAILLILLIFLIIKFVNRKLSYADMEDQLVEATSKYLKEHPDSYPTESNPSVTILGETLVNEKYLKKEINKLVKDTCSAEIEVLFKNESYQVKPFLSCSRYDTKLFYDKVLEDNPVTSKGSGLYDLNEMVVFRGDSPNNYVKFNDTLWRIVKMDPVDYTVTMILDDIKYTVNGPWDNRYNTTEESKHGINHFSLSVISNTLDTLYQENFSDKAKSYMLPMNICAGERSETESINDGSVECSYILPEQKYLSLLPLYDYINASTDYQCTNASSFACQNYNYLVNPAGKWWTLTPDGYQGTKVYSINFKGRISSEAADSKKYARYVAAIDGSMIYRKGNGTSSNPYIFI